MNASWYDVLDVDPDRDRPTRSGRPGGPPSPTSTRPTGGSGSTTRPPRCCSTRARGRRTTRELAAEHAAAEADEAARAERRGDARPSRSRRASPSRAPRRRRAPRLRARLAAGRAGRPVAAALGDRRRRCWRKPSDAAVEDDTEAAQAAAERAIVPILSYDAQHLDQSAAAAQPYMTVSEQEQYDKLFAVIRQNAPRDRDRRPGQVPRLRASSGRAPTGSTCSCSSTR